MTRALQSVVESAAVEDLLREVLRRLESIEARLDAGTRRTTPDSCEGVLDALLPAIGGAHGSSLFTVSELPELLGTATFLALVGEMTHTEIGVSLSRAADSSKLFGGFAVRRSEHRDHNKRLWCVMGAPQTLP